MNQNEGTIDRVIRVALGLGLLSLTVIGPHTWFGLIGIVPFLTGVVGFARFMARSAFAPARPALPPPNRYPSSSQRRGRLGANPFAGQWL